MWSYWSSWASLACETWSLVFTFHWLSPYANLFRSSDFDANMDVTRALKTALFLPPDFLTWVIFLSSSMPGLLTLDASLCSYICCHVHLHLLEGAHFCFYILSWWANKKMRFYSLLLLCCHHQIWTGGKLCFLLFAALLFSSCPWWILLNIYFFKNWENWLPQGKILTCFFDMLWKSFSHTCVVLVLGSSF